jgi:hypothetical protein
VTHMLLDAGRRVDAGQVLVVLETVETAPLGATGAN